MINAKMRKYNYYTLNNMDAYGQQVISAEVKGSIKMSIYTTSQSIQSNILYQNAQYLGLTHDKTINDTFVIEYNNMKLKVLYVNDTGRFTQVFMAKVE